MFKSLLKAFDPLVKFFDPDFCDQAIDYLHKEIKLLQQEKLKAISYIREVEKGDMTNPIRIICANDVDQFIKKVDMKINIAEESICELNLRKHTYDISKNILKEEPAGYIKDLVVAANRRDSPTFSDSSGSSGYHSAGPTQEVRKYPEGTVALLGGEVPYFTLKDSTLPQSLYGFSVKS